MEHAAESMKQKGGAPAKGSAARPAFVEEAPLHPVLQLQRQVGNQAVLAMLRSGALQAKLAVGSADDPAEKEADEVAERVMRKPSGAGAIGACTCAAGGEMCEECRKKELEVPGAAPVVQRRAVRGAAGMSNAPPIVHQTLGGSGRPLDAATRADMEGRFGYDFSAVRIHADARAAESAKSIDAFAYAVGNDIAFGEGQYAPQSEAGQRLLAHELTHVAQHDAAGGAIRRQPDPNAPATQAPSPVTPAPPAPEPQACLPEAQVCASPSPQPGPAAKKPPQPAGTTIVFEGVQLAANSKFLYYQLEQMIVQKGEAATDAFAYRFINMTLENKIQLQLSGYDPSLIADIQVYLREEILRIEYDNKEFITLFQQKATDVTSEILDNSKTQIEKELQHYGITSTDIVSGETVSTIYSMSDKSAGKGLQAAAAVLAKKRREVNQAGNRALKSQSEVQKSAKDNPFLIPENLKGAAEQDRDAWLKQEDEYKDLRGVKEGLFPILATYSTGEDAVQRLERLAASPPGGVAQSIGEIADEKLKNIAVVRGELGKRFSIWKQPQIINITKKQLNATSMQSRAINDAAIKINEDKESSQKLFAAIAIGLGLLAAIPTGGSSLLVGIAAAATVVGAGLTVYGAYEHLQEFSLEQAASGTDFDKAKAISQDEPSMLWLALDIVAAVADIYGAAKAFKSLRAVMAAAEANRLAKLPEVVDVARKAGLSTESQARVVAAVVGSGGGINEIKVTLKTIGQVFKKLDPGVDRKLAEAFQKAAEELIVLDKVKVIPTTLKLQRQAIRDAVGAAGDWKLADSIFNELQAQGTAGVYNAHLDMIFLKGQGSPESIASFLSHEIAHQTQELKIGVQNMSLWEQEFQAFVAEREFLKLLPPESVPLELRALRNATNADIDKLVLSDYEARAWLTKPRAFENDEAVVQASADKILELLKTR